MTATGDHAHGVEPRLGARASHEEALSREGVQPIWSANHACDGVFETNTELDEFLQFTYATPRWRTPAGNGSSRWPPRWKPDPAPAPGGPTPPRGRLGHSLHNIR